MGPALCPFASGATLRPVPARRCPLSSATATARMGRPEQGGPWGPGNFTAPMPMDPQQESLSTTTFILFALLGFGATLGIISGMVLLWWFVRWVGACRTTQ